MRRITLLALFLTLMIICGVVIAYLVTDEHDNHLPRILPAAPEGKPSSFSLIQSQDIAVVFINILGRGVPIPLDTPTVLDRGDLVTAPTGGGGWETKVLRTTTHLTITHESDIGQYRKLEHTVPLSVLPMDFPHDQIQTMVDGRFEVTKGGQSSGPAGQEIEVLFAGHEMLYAGRELFEIPYGRRTLINTGPLTLTVSVRSSPLAQSKTA